MLQFDPEKHIYTFEGRIIPHVTGILAFEGFVDSRWFDDWSRERGRHVHQAIQFYNDGELDEEALDPLLVPYLEAWKEFWKHTKCEIIHSEEKVFSDVYWYAGTLDIYGKIKERPVIIDLKSGVVDVTTGLQLAAYALTFPTYYNVERYGLRLKPDGKFTIKPFTDKNDFRVWQSIVAVHHWKNNNLKGRK